MSDPQNGYPPPAEPTPPSVPQPPAYAQPATGPAASPAYPSSGGEYAAQAPGYPASGAAYPQAVYPSPAAKLPFSKQAIWGFIISCVSVFVFGFIGILGVLLSQRALRAARAGLVRGRGLAIAGMIIGAAGFLYYLVAMILRLTL